MVLSVPSLKKVHSRPWKCTMMCSSVRALRHCLSCNFACDKLLWSYYWEYQGSVELWVMCQIDSYSPLGALQGPVDPNPANCFNSCWKCGNMGWEESNAAILIPIAPLISYRAVQQSGLCITRPGNGIDDEESCLVGNMFSLNPAVHFTNGQDFPPLFDLILSSQSQRSSSMLSW